MGPLLQHMSSISHYGAHLASTKARCETQESGGLKAYTFVLYLPDYLITLLFCLLDRFVIIEEEVKYMVGDETLYEFILNRLPFVFVCCFGGGLIGHIYGVKVVCGCSLMEVVRYRACWFVSNY